MPRIVSSFPNGTHFCMDLYLFHTVADVTLVSVATRFWYFPRPFSDYMYVRYMYVRYVNVQDDQNILYCTLVSPVVGGGLLRRGVNFFRSYKNGGS